MKLYVYDRNDVQIGILKNLISVTWHEKYDESGSFVIHAKPTKENVYLLNEDNRVVNADGGTIGFIEFILLDLDLEVRGHLDNLNMRINAGITQIRDVQPDLLRLISNNKRGLDIKTKSNPKISKRIEHDTSHKNISETISTVCKSTGIGYRMIKDGETLNVFELYEAGKTNAVFSEEIGNAIISDYYMDLDRSYNFAYVGGAGEGAERRIISIDRSNGEDIRECFVDARDIQPDWYDDDGEKHTYSQSDYDALLRQRGNEYLDDHKKIKLFEFDIKLNNRTFEFGVDYKLGDIVTVKSEKFNMTKRFRISGLKTVQEDEYMKVGTVREVL